MRAFSVISISALWDTLKKSAVTDWAVRVMPSRLMPLSSSPSSLSSSLPSVPE